MCSSRRILDLRCLRYFWSRCSRFEIGAIVFPWDYTKTRRLIPCKCILCWWPKQWNFRTWATWHVRNGNLRNLIWANDMKLRELWRRISFFFSRLTANRIVYKGVVKKRLSCSLFGQIQGVVVFNTGWLFVVWIPGDTCEARVHYESLGVWALDSSLQKLMENAVSMIKSSGHWISNTTHALPFETLFRAILCVLSHRPRKKLVESAYVC